MCLSVGVARFVLFRVLPMVCSLRVLSLVVVCCVWCLLSFLSLFVCSLLLFSDCCLLRCLLCVVCGVLFVVRCLFLVVCCVFLVDSRSLFDV